LIIADSETIYAGIQEKNRVDSYLPSKVSVVTGPAKRGVKAGPDFQVLRVITLNVLNQLSLNCIQR